MGDVGVGELFPGVINGGLKVTVPSRLTASMSVGTPSAGMSAGMSAAGTYCLSVVEISYDEMETVDASASARPGGSASATRAEPSVAIASAGTTVFVPSDWQINQHQIEVCGHSE